MVALTSKAADKIKATLGKEGRPKGCLRLGVSSGGCSGMNYVFKYADAPKEGDKITEFEGAVLAVDAKAHTFVDGSTVDYHKTLMESGFRVKNPNATTSCNCGVSFTTAPTQPTSGASLFD